MGFLLLEYGPVISEMLGYKTQEITEAYLKAFENNVLDDAVKRLL